MKTLILGIILLVFSGCQSRYDKIEEMTFLLGTWESNVQGKIMHERWTKINDSLYLGQSYFMEDSDTLISEEMQLTLIGEKLFFIANPSPNDTMQNSVKFELIEQEDDKSRFENLFHDFPQSITYAKITKDSVLAYIDGNYKGSYNRIDFPMKRKK